VKVVPFHVDEQITYMYITGKTYYR